jgi:flagellar biogenesis protein FliO
LKVSETISLGEKRFVAVIQVDGLQFLLGGGATNVTLLTQLNATETFGDVLKETMNTPKKQMGKQIRKQTAKRTTEQTREQA